ncbi:MAG: O-linked N-acetylglucosamine transferase, SPINDLY family protein [Cyanobacteria bacterium P01_E01_bin.42]
MSEHWHKQAIQYYQQEDYGRAVTFYELLAEAHPEEKLYYWQLGLMLLLQGNAAEAQTTWLMAMLEGNSQQVTQWNKDLEAIVSQEVDRQESLERQDLAWKICQQLRELFPEKLSYCLHWLRFGLELKEYVREHLKEANIISLLQDEINVEFELLLSVLYLLLLRDCTNPQVLELAEISLEFAKTPQQKETIAELFRLAALDISYFQRQAALGARLCELGMKASPKNQEIAYYLSTFAQDAEDYEKGIDAAYLHLALVDNLPDRLFGNKALLKAFMITGGNWQESLQAGEKHQKLLKELLTQQPTNLTLLQATRLFNTYFFSAYFRDTPRENRTIINQVAELCRKNLQILAKETSQCYQKGHQNRFLQRQSQQKIRIGYLSFCLKIHSVGWLARSLFHHHNRDRFELYGYFISPSDSKDALQEWYINQVDKGFKSTDALKLAETIFQDEIDILIELDSLTADTTCHVVSLKPAPVQVTWLGWDASGISTIDYFIADPYVLPDCAQNYYQEKIWRLSHSYIACDGFEIGIPTLEREMLEIPEEAIIYYSVQKGFKRHPDTIRLQLKIIKNVPNSYFLIKGSSDKKAVKNAFCRLADEEGVQQERLRFLDIDTTETVHRANLGIADIVLDTYPYNGATTTMETLWMGIPLVTKVGQQFSARNSYTMLINVGVKEGIAWTDKEYLDWGVRFGLDESLRQKVSWQLQKARYTQPLWDGKKFTREMETAYQEMWENYLQKNKEN